MREPCGKALGNMAADAALGKAYRALGLSMIAAGTDHGILMGRVRAILSEIGG